MQREERASTAENRFDVIVIGAGPGGMAAALRGALNGLRVALVNAQPLWGNGMLGAYRSKGMYELAKDHSVASKPGRGYLPVPPRVDFSQVQEQLTEGCAELETLYRDQIRMTGVIELAGRGGFVDSHTIGVGADRYRADKIIIATGTAPRWLPAIQRGAKRIMSSDEIVTLNRLPESMVIVGAGVIGCEFASIFGSFGCEVALLDSRPVILSHEDSDLVNFLTENFERHHIRVNNSVTLKSMREVEGNVVTQLQDGTVLRTEAALVAVGRTPATSALGLETVGVKMDDQGYIPVNDLCQTNVEHIYAVGDVGLRDTELDMSLVHVAEAEGHQAMHHILGGSEPIPMNHIPFIIFTIPLIAGAGENEKTGRANYGAVRVARLDNARNHRAHAMRAIDGFVKLIVGPEGDDRILGVRACGAHADSLIGEVSLCIQYNLPYTHLMDAVHAHPSLSESLNNAARMLAGLYPE